MGKLKLNTVWVHYLGYQAYEYESILMYKLILGG